jgi:signal transduction histidine kinase
MVFRLVRSGTAPQSTDHTAGRARIVAKKMTTLQSGRLFWKYLAIIVALVTIASTATALVQLRSWSSDSRHNLAQLHREKVDRAADVIEKSLRDVERQIAWSMSPVQDAAAVGIDRRFEDYLRLLRQAPAITDVTYLDASGREQLFVSRVSMYRIGSGTDSSSELRFLRARRNEPYFSPVYLLRESEPYLTISVREIGGNGGVTSAEVNLKLIGGDLTSSLRASETVSAYAVDDRGQLIAHPDMSRVLKAPNLGSLPHVQSAMSFAAQSPTHPENSPSQVAFGHDELGREVLAAYRVVAPTGWIAFVEQPVEEAFAPIYASTWHTAIVLALGLLLSTVASLLLARRMVKPIRALSAGAARIGAGALDQRIQIRTGDELEVLANEFNRMAEQLHELYTRLEQRVDERTRELAGALHELEAKTRELEIGSRHKSEFLASMSHELRTPLNSVIGFSTVLLQEMFGQLNDKQEEYLKDILVSGEHLLSLVNDILDLVKFDVEVIELEPSEFWLPETLENTLGMFRETAIQHDLSLKLSTSPEVGMVTADLRRLRQILFNLLSNALKFTPAGGTIELSAREDGTTIHLAVRDTGLGIPAEDQGHVFEAFHRSAATASSHEGTGLGLTLVKRFVELHGGTVWLTSAPGEGTTIEFTLPQLAENDVTASPKDGGQYGPTVAVGTFEPPAST